MISKYRLRVKEWSKLTLAIISSTREALHTEDWGSCWKLAFSESVINKSLSVRSNVTEGNSGYQKITWGPMQAIELICVTWTVCRIKWRASIVEACWYVLGTHPISAPNCKLQVSWPTLGRHDYCFSKDFSVVSNPVIATHIFCAYFP